MHASMFSLDLGSSTAPRYRARRGRSLATALADLPGFVAFIAIEAEDGTVAGLCICVDEEALEDARRRTEDWHREAGGSAHTAFDPSLQSQIPTGVEALVSGEVIVQRGF